MQWFRLHAEFATDPVVQSLAFDDQRHFIVLLCFKASGLLDRPFGNPQTRTDVIRKTLGLDGKAWDEMRNRLQDCGLIDTNLQPVNWDKRQFLSDSSTERTRAYRERTKRHGNVTVTVPETETDTETEKKKGIPRVPRSAAPPVPAGVPPSLWADWLAVRRAKKQPLTATALEAVRKEAEKAKLTLAEAIRMSVENGWAGFKHSWILEAQARLAKAGATDSSIKPWHETASGTKAMGAKLGLEPENFCRADGTQDWQAFAAAVKKRAGVPAMDRG